MQGGDLLSGSIALLNVAVDEGGEVVGGGEDLILLLGDAELRKELLQDLDALRVLGLDLPGGGVCSGGSHFDKKVRRLEREKVGGVAGFNIKAWWGREKVEI